MAVLAAACGGGQYDPTVSLPAVDKQCLAARRHDINNGSQVAEPEPPTDTRPVPGKPFVVPPNAIAGKRIFGRTLIMPDADTQDAIRIEAIPRICPSFKLCLDETGVPEQIAVKHTSCFPRYEAHMIENIREWRYSPFMVDGAGVKVCTTINLCYSQRPRP